MKFSIAAVLIAIGIAAAYCPDCDVAANTTVEFDPAVITGENQTVKLTATLNCPKDTWHRLFTGYTIDWGDGSQEYALYDLEKQNYKKCKDAQHITCENPDDTEHRKKLKGYSAFTKSHTYKDKKSYSIEISFTMLQNQSNQTSSNCGKVPATVSTKTADLTANISTTPLNYCAIPKGYALFATNDLSINDRATCSKNENSSTACVAGAEGNIVVGVKAVVDEVHSNQILTLRNYSKVYSGVWAKTIDAQKGAEFTQKGTSTKFQYDAGINSTFFKDQTEFIENGETKIYGPGVYGDVTVRRGGTLTLKSDGVYVFRNVRFEVGSELKLKGTKVTELYAQEFNFSGTVTGAKAENFLVGVLGNSGTDIDNGFVGSVWAPKSRLVIGQFHHKLYRGSYMGKEIFVPQDTKIDYVSFTKNRSCK